MAETRAALEAYGLPIVPGEITDRRAFARVDPDRDEPPRFGPPVLAAIEQRLLAQGLRPFPMPSAVDFGAGGRCQRCANCALTAASTTVRRAGCCRSSHWWRC